MGTYVSMLRGVNVSGQRMVKMAELRSLYESLGFRGVRTYLQSGNVVFQNRADATAARTAIEREVKERLGLDVVVIIRTAEELSRVVKGRPFVGKDDGKVYVTFLSAEPSDFPASVVEGARRGSEALELSGREVYLFLPNGYGTTKLTNGFFEKKLKVSATTRNWRTVSALLSMASA
jgi:uncharacterized protein (DUF1697 family)